MKEKMKLSLENVYKKSWELLKKNFGPLILIVFLGMVLVAIFVVPGALALLTGIGAFSGKEQIQFNSFTVIGIVIFVAAVILSACVSIVYSTALIKAIGNADEGKKIDVKEAFKFGYDNFWKVLWAGLISGLIILAGFILLIIPGIILAIFLQFVIFAVIFQKKTGYDAVTESYNLVKGHFGMVFLIIASVIILQGALSWIPAVGSLIAFLLTPFWQIITYMTYKSLGGLKNHEQTTS